MDWNQLFPILNQKFNSERCMERLRSIYERDHWISFDRRPETANYCARTMAEAGLEQIEQPPCSGQTESEIFGRSHTRPPASWENVRMNRSGISLKCSRTTSIFCPS